MTREVVPERSVFPLSKRDEKELLDILTSTSGNTGTDAHHLRVELLSEILARPSIVDQQGCLAVVIDIARKHGSSKPEGLMISQLLRALVAKNPYLLSSLLLEFRNKELSLQFTSCATVVIKGLGVDEKGFSIEYLTSALLAQPSVTGVANDLIDALSSMSEPRLAAEITRTLAPELTKADPVRVLLSIRVLSRIGSRDLINLVLSVLERALDDWYGVQTAEIQFHVLTYLARNPDEKALPSLMKLMQVRPSGELVATLKSFQYPSVASTLLELLQESMNDFRRYETMRWTSMALSEIDPKLIDVKKLITNDSIFKNSEPRFHAKKVMLALGEQAKPLLIDLLKDDKPERFEFALECLAEIGLTADEASGVFKENPANSLYEFFYGKKMIDIWDETDSATLGSTLKRSDLKKIDYFVLSLLSAFNLLTIYVDPSGKPGVDVLGLSLSSPHLIVAGATSGPLKDDVSKLLRTLSDMRTKIGELMARHVVFPVIFTLTPIQNLSPNDLELARQNGVIVLGRDDIGKVLSMARLGRSTRELIAFLGSKKSAL
jgi:hypothetical protein